MRAALKMMLVFSVKTSSSSVNFDMSTLMAPVWRQATEKFDGYSLKPSGWPHPPFRACEMWQVTPGIFGSSQAVTHTLSLGESKLNVVLMQLKSSARAKAGAATKSTIAIKHSFTFDLHFRGALGRLRADRLVSMRRRHPTLPAKSNAVDRPEVPLRVAWEAPGATKTRFMARVSP